jgi:hypothetical protein
MKTSYKWSISFLIIVGNLYLLLPSLTKPQSNKPIAPQQQINKPVNQKEASILLKERKAIEILTPFKVL